MAEQGTSYSPAKAIALFLAAHEKRIAQELKEPPKPENKE